MLAASQHRSDAIQNRQVNALEESNRLTSLRLQLQSTGAKPLSDAALNRYTAFAASTSGVRAAGVTTFANKVHGLPAKRALEELNAKMLTEGFIAANFHPTFVEALRSANFASELNCPAPFGPFTLTSSEESILADLSVSEFTDLSSTDTNALSEPRRAQFARAQALIKKAKIVVAPSLTELGETTKLLKACATAYFGSVSNVTKWAREWHEFATEEPSKIRRSPCRDSKSSTKISKTFQCSSR